MPENEITVVLAHGAWADGSSWSKVIGLLQASGFTSIAAPLPLASLADDVAALDRTLERVGGPVVLVAHAYAGAYLCRCTRAGRIRNGSGYLLPGRTAPECAETRARSPRVCLASDEAFATAFAQHATVDEQIMLAAVQRPIALSCISTKVGRPLWMDRPSWFLIAEQDRMIHPDTQRFLAARMKAKVRSYPTDHTPSVTSPQPVVDVILDAIRDISTQ